MSFISPTDKKTFQAILLLNVIKYGSIPIMLGPDDSIIEPLLVELMSKGYISTTGLNYKLTTSGEEVFANFMKRYSEYLKLYDVFAFVDLDSAEFAFTKYWTFNTDAEWTAFKSDPRFEDVRIAVALFKKLNPAEIVFMSFINENRFDTSSTGWQFDVMTDKIWEEIEAICQSAYKPEQFGTSAMEDMIKQGAEIVINLLKEEESRARIAADGRAQYQASQQQEVLETVVEETVIVESVYYEPYYDPFYISPFWLVPLFLW